MSSWIKNEFFGVLGHVWRRAPRPVRGGVLALTQRSYTAGVVGLVPNKDDAVLVLRPRFRVPYAWGLPGVFLEGGETPNQAFARELREETGINVEVCAGVLEHELNHRSRSVSYVVVAIPIDAELTQLSPELVDFRFCTPDTLPQELQPTHRALVERYWAKAQDPIDNLLVVS